MWGQGIGSHLCFMFPSPIFIDVIENGELSIHIFWASINSHLPSTIFLPLVNNSGMVVQLTLAQPLSESPLLLEQGMSDLAAPILCTMKDEAEAFWCFAALMDRMESNFHVDCT